MTPDTPNIQGICPNCELHRGAVGETCPEPGCARKEFRYIPVEWHSAAKQFAAKKQRPLDPLLGRSIDRYLIAGKLGEGGMGAVYLALQRPLNREVALKIISGLELDTQAIARFEREARAISVLDHPNIVKLYDYGVGELEFRVPYMAIEYVKHGRTLRSALSDLRRENKGAAIPGETILAIFSQILNALGTAHQMGIVHRDMKPDNVMLGAVMGNAHMVKVLDFGLAKAVSDVSGFDNNVSRTGQFLGTPYYMAPEQAISASNGHDVDGRADLFAVAVMLFEVFTGVRPFDGETPLEVITRKIDPQFSPMELPQALPLHSALKAFLDRGMAREPVDRFPTAGAMLEELEQAISGRHVTAQGLPGGSFGSSKDRPITPPSARVIEPADPFSETKLVEEVSADFTFLKNRRSVWPWVMAVVVLVAVAGVLLFMFAGSGDPDRPTPAHMSEVDAASIDVVPSADIPVVLEPDVMTGDVPTASDVAGIADIALKTATPDTSVKAADLAPEPSKAAQKRQSVPRKVGTKKILPKKGKKSGGIEYPDLDWDKSKKSDYPTIEW